MKTKLVSILFAVLSLTADSFVAAEEPGAAPAKLESLKILAASYSYGGQSADVTERVKKLLRNDKIFSANPDWLETDPHPGMAKALFIFCEVNGKPSALSVGEGEDVSRDILGKKAWAVATETEAQIDLRAKPVAEDATENAYAAETEAFPTITTPVDEQGAPDIQTIRLNDKVAGGAGRVSGFRFRVDRTQAAALQKVADKTTMDLFWFFGMPREVASWYIAPVKGSMQRGFDNFFPIKPEAFKNGSDLLPKDKHFIVIQRLAADRLKEGEEYVMWFSCKEGAEAPVEMSVALGYRVDDRNFKGWEDLTGLSKFLGLVPSGDRVGVDQRWQK